MSAAQRNPIDVLAESIAQSEDGYTRTDFPDVDFAELQRLVCPYVSCDENFQGDGLDLSDVYVGRT